MKLKISIQENGFCPANSGRTGCNECLPDVQINQETGNVTVLMPTQGYTREKYPSASCVEAPVPRVSTATNKQAAFVRGLITVRNYKNWQNSGQQQYCFAIFVGDSGHIYVHRAPATKVWMALKPSQIFRRLRELGDPRAARAGTIQQGDVLLIPCAAKELMPVESFRHELNRIGHHVFSLPVLESNLTGRENTQVLILEAVRLFHRPSSGAIHPEVEVPNGQYQVALTARSLRGGGKD